MLLGFGHAGLPGQALEGLRRAGVVSLFAEALGRGLRGFAHPDGRRGASSERPPTGGQIGASLGQKDE
jgi:hypothetical protein